MAPPDGEELQSYQMASTVVSALGGRTSSKKTVESKNNVTQAPQSIEYNLHEDRGKRDRAAVWRKYQGMFFVRCSFLHATLYIERLSMQDVVLVWRYSPV